MAASTRDNRARLATASSDQAVGRSTKDAIRSVFRIKPYCRIHDVAPCGRSELSNNEVVDVILSLAAGLQNLGQLT